MQNGKPRLSFDSVLGEKGQIKTNIMALDMIRLPGYDGYFL